MLLLGYSLDNLSLMALTLAVGLLVDDAVVVLENTVRHLEDGKPPRWRALLGSKEISFTVLSMTFSLAAIFIPVVFMPGIIGRMFHEMAVTIVVAIVLIGRCGHRRLADGLRPTATKGGARKPLPTLVQQKFRRVQGPLQALAGMGDEAQRACPSDLAAIPGGNNLAVFYRSERVSACRRQRDDSGSLPGRGRHFARTDAGLSETADGDCKGGTWRRPGHHCNGAAKQPIDDFDGPFHRLC